MATKKRQLTLRKCSRGRVSRNVKRNTKKCKKAAYELFLNPLLKQGAASTLVMPLSEVKTTTGLAFQGTVGALIIRIGFGGILYYN